MPAWIRGRSPFASIIRPSAFNFAMSLFEIHLRPVYAGQRALRHDSIILNPLPALR